jgi:tetratricopeptide (TPR) repeat protein
MGKREERCPHMNLADERLKQLDDPSLSENERTLIRCRVAADLIHRGQYEAARETLGGLWLGVGQRPPVTKLPPAIEAELLLQCGALTGWLGSARNVSGAQEQAKNMLSEAARTFRAQGLPAKVSETQYELAACYWRLGQLDEARVVLQEALAPLTDADVELKAKILIRRTNVEVWENRYHEALSILKEAEPVFQSANDALKGRWHGQRAIIYLKLSATERRAEEAF